MKKTILFVIVFALSVLLAACPRGREPSICESDDHCAETEVCCDGQCSPKESEDSCGTCDKVCPDPMYCVNFQPGYYGCECPTISCNGVCCQVGQECLEGLCQ